MGKESLNLSLYPEHPEHLSVFIFSKDKKGFKKFDKTAI